MVALYKSTNKEGDVKYQKVKATISKPQKPLVKTFYEQYWTDKRLLKQSLDQGKILEGRLFFDKNAQDRSVGFVKLDPIPLPPENEGDEI